MFYFKGCLFCILALTSFTYAVKVNMHGSLSLGKEVMDTLSYYLLSGHIQTGRRSMSGILDPIAIQIRTASICNNLELCTGKLETFIIEYVTSLAKAVEVVFEGIFNEQVATTPIFQKMAKSCLHDARKVLKAANDKVTENKEGYLWITVIKKISSSFQRKAFYNIINQLDADKDIDLIKKKLTQKLVIFIASAEVRAEKRLCSEYQLCVRGLAASRALYTVLNTLITLSDEKIKQFMRAFFDVLPDTTFYSRLSEVTANEFQVILNDMAYFENVPTKEILSSIQLTVENRINVIDSNAEVKKGQDILLVHIILSDMDYIYSRMKSEPFHSFLDYFLDWTKTGRRLTSAMKDVVLSIEENLRATPEVITIKLITEVRVFLEITVDP